MKTDHQVLPRRTVHLSIVIPVFNEAAVIGQTLAAAVAAVAVADLEAEIIVVDGGSSDATMHSAMASTQAYAIQESCRFQIIQAPRGRAAQMNAGAALATGDVLLFLHADTLLPAGAGRAVIDGLRNIRGLPPTPSSWGRFDVQIAGRARMLKVVARCMNLRSRLTGIATGDQAIFVTREAFAAAGGFPIQPLMEDIALSRTLKQRCAPVCLHLKVVTSERRWECNGVWRTILLMWTLRLRYWLGASPECLKRAYK
ncbi:MAG: TIGR04283 family arsenosugar biosynthesis glycosyltransferase [Pseudomonadota bacterium]